MSVIYLFYWVLLRMLTFYNWNRWYLLGYTALCFVIPFVDVFAWLQYQGLQNVAVVNYIPAIVEIQPANIASDGGSINWRWIAATVFAAGCLVMLFRLLVQFISLWRMKSSAVLLSDSGVKLYHVDRKIVPFSTARAIYINRNLHQEDELKEIIRHEFIHVKQRHSFDLLFGEVLCILNWFNPFAWLIRKAIRQNLEFIADRQVLQSGLDRKEYQYLLLKVTGISSFSIAANFNFSSLKKRIAMMNKNKSARVNVVRFLFILPLLVVVLLAFRSVVVKAENIASAHVRDTVPATPLPPTIVKLPKEVSRIINNNGIVTVTLKNGKTEQYDLSKKEEKAAFVEKYGELPKPPELAVAPIAPVPAIAPVIAVVPAPAAPTPVAAPTVVAVPAPPAAPTPVGAPKPATIPAPPPVPKAATAPGPATFPAPAVAPVPPAPPVHPAKTDAEFVLTSDSIIVDGPNKEMTFTARGTGKVRATGRSTGAKPGGQTLVANAFFTASGNAVATTTDNKTIITADKIVVTPEKSPRYTVAGTIVMDAIGKQEAVAELSNQFTRAQVDALKDALLAKGFTLDIADSKFDDNKLSSLRATISKDGIKASFSVAGFYRIEIGLITYKDGREHFNINVYNGTMHL